jgi:hypothetical protein
MTGGNSAGKQRVQGGKRKNGGMRKNLVVGALAVAVLSGCLQTRPATRPIDTHADDVDCGVHDLRQGEHLTAGAAQCIVDAAAKGGRGHMTVTRPTIEGDPIVAVYSVQKDGAVIVETDTTQDRFGNNGVVRQACTGPYTKDAELLFEHCEPD